MHWKKPETKCNWYSLNQKPKLSMETIIYIGYNDTHDRRPNDITDIWLQSLEQKLKQLTFGYTHWNGNQNGNN